MDLPEHLSLFPGQVHTYTHWSSTISATSNNAQFTTTGALYIYQEAISLHKSSKMHLPSYCCSQHTPRRTYPSQSDYLVKCYLLAARHNLEVRTAFMEIYNLAGTSNLVSRVLSSKGRYHLLPCPSSQQSPCNSSPQQKTRQTTIPTPNLSSMFPYTFSGNNLLTSARTELQSVPNPAVSFTDQPLSTLPQLILAHRQSTASKSTLPISPMPRLTSTKVQTR